MKKIVLSFIITILSINCINSQTNYFDPQIKTPGVSDFVKYGNINSTSYTGELKLNIPILNFAIPQQNSLDISLSYVASGFRPNKRNGLVGQNWFLNVGGAITREVNGMPDDQKGVPTTNGLYPNYTNGFIVGASQKTHNPQDVFQFNSNTAYTNQDHEPQLYANSSSNGLDSNNYEGDPDVFSFNFNGISGKFFMGNDGEVKITTNIPHKLKVDLSEFAFQDVSNSTLCKPKTPSRITILDEKGNKYFFGGESKNLEYTLSTTNQSSSSTSDHRPVINSWYLYKIEYYTGYVLNFNYRDDSILTNIFADQYQIIHGGYYTDVNDARRDFVQLSEYYSDDRALFQNSGTMTGTGGVGGNGGGSYRLTIQKIAILDNIQGENFNINFNYSRQSHKFNTRDNDNYPVNNSSYFNEFKDIKLDNITFQGRTVSFGYEYLGGTTNSRMFLSSVTESGKTPHEFEYYPTGDLPQPITFGLDHWSFWNGKSANTNPLIPYILLDANGDFTYPSGNPNSTTRNPNFTYSLKGQLKKVIYPTGGYSEFEYEQHSYNKRLEVRSIDNFVPQLYNESGIAGGIRIKKITNYDGFNNVNIKEYNYENSGILLKWPRYASFWSYSSQTFGFLRCNPIGRNIMENIVVSYGKVREIYSDNGYKRTIFRDFSTNPDNNESNFIEVINGASSDPSAPLAKNYIGYFLNDRSVERGKPSKIEFYNESNHKKKEILYEYNESVNRFDNYTAKLHLSGPFTQTNKIYHYQDYLTNETVKEYPLNNIAQYITTESIKEYDANNLLVNEKVRNQYDNYIENQYTYQIIPTENLVLLDKTEKFVNSIKTFETQTEYGNSSDVQTNNKYLPKKISSAKFPNSGGGLEDRFSFLKYDNRNNPVEVKVEAGIHTVYLWGYSKSLVIAKIENATLAEVATALGVSESVVLNYNESNLTSIDALRTNPLLSQSFITTYKHIPHVGVQSITDPKNETFTFIYDDAKRLKYVQDSQGYITNEYLYHYLNQ